MAKSMRESVRVRVENEGITSARKMLSVRPQPVRRLRFEQRTRLPRRTSSLDVSAYQSWLWNRTLAELKKGVRRYIRKRHASR